MSPVRRHHDLADAFEHAVLGVRTESSPVRSRRRPDIRAARHSAEVNASFGDDSPREEEVIVTVRTRPLGYVRD